MKEKKMDVYRDNSKNLIFSSLFDWGGHSQNKKNQVTTKNVEYKNSFNIFLTLIQIVFTTTILYMGLTYNEHNVGEKERTIQFADYVEVVESGKLSQMGFASLKVESDGILLSKNSKDIETEIGTKEDRYVLASRRVEEAMAEIYTPIHGVVVTDEDMQGYDKKFQDICFANLALCMKARFDPALNYKDKYMYLASIVQVVGGIDKISNMDTKLRSTLDEIQVTQEAGSRRGHSTWDTVVLNIGNIQSYAEFLEVLSHEIGHIWDLGALQGSAGTKDATFTEFNRAVFATNDPSILYYQVSWTSEKVRKSSAKKDDFCSGYGMSDPFEDLAECFNLYMNHNAMFKEIAKSNSALRQKYNFVANYFNNNYMLSTDNDLTYISNDNTRRPYDTTKIR